MLRSAVTRMCRFHQSLPLLQQGLDNGVERRLLHLSGVAPSVGKDIPGLSKSRDREEREREKGVSGSTEQEGAEEQMEGFKFDSMFPTLETHGMMINNTRYDELPVVHIKATHNNTIVSIADGKGVPLAMESGGTVGFRNARKGTNIAAQAAAIALAQTAVKKGINLVRVSVKGIGPGRLPAIKGVQMSGLTIVSVTDATPLPHNGLRPKKQRRL